MAPRIRLRPCARADLDDIWTYTVARWGRAQAVDYLSGLDGAFRLLADFPEIARLRREFTPPVRIHRYREHVIIYLSGNDAIDILRVAHARANWSEFLAD